MNSVPWLTFASDPHYKDITVRQMVTHTSGMPDVEDYEWNRPEFDDGALNAMCEASKTRLSSGSPVINSDTATWRLKYSAIWSVRCRE